MPHFISLVALFAQCALAIDAGAEVQKQASHPRGSSKHEGSPDAIVKSEVAGLLQTEHGELQNHLGTDGSRRRRRGPRGVSS